MTTNGYGNEDYPSQLDDNIASPAVDSGVHKKRLRSWLLDKLDTNDCPGCTWINKEQRIFKLTWKHYGRPGFDEERVFRWFFFICLFLNVCSKFVGLLYASFAKEICRHPQYHRYGGSLEHY